MFLVVVVARHYISLWAFLNAIVGVVHCFQLLHINNMPPNQGLLRDLPPLDGALVHSDDDSPTILRATSGDDDSSAERRRIRCAILGCGMMVRNLKTCIAYYTMPT